MTTPSNNVGIIGVGKLGLAYALSLEQKGFNVFASSYKAEYIRDLKLRKTESLEPGIPELLASAENIQFTVDNHEIIDACDLIYVMVATPSNQIGDYDVSAVQDVVNDFLSHHNSVQGKILVVGCTVNPGTCVNLQQQLDHLGVAVVYCPTFAAQGTVLRDLENPHTLSLGTEDVEVANRCEEVFSRLIAKDTPIFRVHPTTAEILKLAGNCRATMEISYFNMIGQILIQSGMKEDLDTSMRYLNFVKKTSRWQFGFGFGGPCYPRDNKSFIHYAKTIGLDFPLGVVVDEFNESHVKYLTDYFVSDNVESLPFYFEYVSYKRGVNIFEESHQLKVCKNLLRQQHQVYIEPSLYLLPKLIEDLTQEFPNHVKFYSKDNLVKDGIKFYTIKL